jgi:diketogulonate reductase-like aldo/keto reductase
MLLFASGLLASALQPHPPRRAAAFHRRDALGLGLGLGLGSPLLTSQPAAAAASTYASSTKLADGLVFPLASFGLQIYDDATAEQLTLRALEAGYRNFFASALAQNQQGFARGVRASGIARDELFICGSVVSNRALDADTAYKLTANGCAENAEAFAAGDIGTLDMIMLDYPGQDDGCIRAQWRAFEDFKAVGGVRSLAVSNFSPAQLDAILKEPGVQRRARPTVNQLPLCVGYHDVPNRHSNLGPTERQIH